MIVFYLIYKVSPVYGDSNPIVYISICSLVGSFLVLSVQGFGSAIAYSGRHWDDDNQFLKWEFYLLLAFIILTIMGQIHFLNKALNQFSTAIVSPVYYVFFTSATLISSAVLFRGFAVESLASGVSLVMGFLVIVGGVALLFQYSIKLKKLANTSGNVRKSLSRRHQGNNGRRSQARHGGGQHDDDDEGFGNLGHPNDDDDDADEMSSINGFHADDRDVYDDDDGYNDDDNDTSGLQRPNLRAESNRQQKNHLKKSNSAVTQKEKKLKQAHPPKVLASAVSMEEVAVVAGTNHGKPIPQTGAPNNASNIWSSLSSKITAATGVNLRSIGGSGSNTTLSGSGGFSYGSTVVNNGHRSSTLSSSYQIDDLQSGNAFITSKTGGSSAISSQQTARHLSTQHQPNSYLAYNQQNPATRIKSVPSAHLQTTPPSYDPNATVPRLPPPPSASSPTRKILQTSTSFTNATLTSSAQTNSAPYAYPPSPLSGSTSPATQQQPRSSTSTSHYSTSTASSRPTQPPTPPPKDEGLSSLRRGVLGSEDHLAEDGSSPWKT
jgi:hypothetical protein